MLPVQVRDVAERFDSDRNKVVLIPPVHAWQEQTTDVERTMQYLSLRGVSSRRIQVLRRMKPS